jgi:hypothetical protein
MRHTVTTGGRRNRGLYWRRRAVAALVLLALVAVPVLAIGAGGDGDGDAGDAAPAANAKADDKPKPKPKPKPTELPRGGRRIFPDYRVVGFYGAPQDDELGVLGIGPTSQMRKKLRVVARGYARKTRPVLPVMELLATIAAAAPGDDGKYIIRQDAKVIDRYLRAARREKALLLLDIQPGHADFLAEARKLERWLKEPDVGLSLDPEWKTPGAQPGSVIGSVSSQEVNAVSAWLSRIVRRRNLPEKLFVVHQFTDDMIRDKQRVKKRPGLAVTMNVDGFGDRPNKVSKYNAFTREAKRFHDGFKLFYREDVNLMKPRNVLAMNPPPDLVVYE